MPTLEVISPLEPIATTGAATPAPLGFPVVTFAASNDGSRTRASLERTDGRVGRLAGPFPRMGHGPWEQTA